MVAVILYALAATWSLAAAVMLAGLLARRRPRRSPCRPPAPYVLVVTRSGAGGRIWLHQASHEEVVRLVRAIEDSNKRDDGDQS